MSAQTMQTLAFAGFFVTGVLFGSALTMIFAGMEMRRIAREIRDSREETNGALVALAAGKPYIPQPRPR